MLLSHKVEHRGDKLQVTFEVPLSDIIAHGCPEAERLNDPLYRHIVSYLLQHVADDLWDVADILKEEGEVGTIKWFDDKKGYGFIRSYDREDVFVHHSQLVGDGYRTVEQGQRVHFRRRFVKREGIQVLEAIDVKPIVP